jgi:hypothetical protein
VICQVVHQQRELDLEKIRRIELQHELELLKTLHAKEILECQFQVRSLLDDSSHDAYQRSQLEKTCEDLRATVSDLSQSLNKLWETNEQDALARTELVQECARLNTVSASSFKERNISENAQADTLKAPRYCAFF